MKERHRQPQWSTSLSQGRRKERCGLDTPRGGSAAENAETNGWLGDDQPQHAVRARARRPGGTNRMYISLSFPLTFLLCAVGGEKGDEGAPTRTSRKPGLLGDY